MDDKRRDELFPGVEVRLTSLERARFGFLALLSGHGERITTSPVLWGRILMAAGSLPSFKLLEVAVYQSPHPDMRTLLLAGVKISDAANAYTDPVYVPVYADSGGEVSPTHGFDADDARTVRSMLDEVAAFAMLEEVRLSEDQTAVTGWER